MRYRNIEYIPIVLLTWINLYQTPSKLEKPGLDTNEKRTLLFELNRQLYYQLPPLNNGVKILTLFIIILLHVEKLNGRFFKYEYNVSKLITRFISRYKEMSLIQIFFQRVPNGISFINLFKIVSHKPMYHRWNSFLTIGHGCQNFVSLFWQQ